MRERSAYEIAQDLAALGINLDAALTKRAKLRRPNSERARRLDCTIRQLRRLQMDAEVRLSLAKSDRLLERGVKQLKKDGCVDITSGAVGDTQDQDQTVEFGRRHWDLP
jgi:hypothetical protein